MKLINNMKYHHKRLSNYSSTLKDINLYKHYGFVPNPSLPPWENYNIHLGKSLVSKYFNRITNTGFHNLCTKTTPPPNVGELLGLGLKFCIQKRSVDKDTTSHTMSRLRRDVRLKFLYAGEDDPDFEDDYIKNKKLYIKSTWPPPLAFKSVEQRLNNFDNSLVKERTSKFNYIKNRTNLSRIQLTLLKELKQNEDILVIQTDKNCGPALIDRDYYIKRILTEHLSDGITYQQISEDSGLFYLQQVKDNLLSILPKYSIHFSPITKNFFRHGIANAVRVPIFYGTAKVHKSTKPHVRFRPVTSQCGSLSAMISTFLDVQLQPFTAHMPAYIKNSFDILRHLHNISILPTNAKLFTADATAMYTNISPADGLPTIEKYLVKYKNENPDLISIDLTMQLLTLVMHNNIFKFGDTWWLQLIGTAMGTPCACIYATMYFAWFERQFILPKYKHNIIFYKRQIDDIFGIWIDSPSSPYTYNDFTTDLNSITSLQWVCEPLLNSVNFLDLTISINNNQTISTKTYQKKENLFLYIPPQSAHPPGMVKSLIYSLLRTYYIQNTHTSDFNIISTRFFNRLLARGYNPETILPLFKESINKIQLQLADKQQLFYLHNSNPDLHPTTNKSNNKLADPNNIFIHLEYHPQDISRHKIRQLYEQHCNLPDEFNQSFSLGITNKEGNTMNITSTTIAYSKPKNLKDHLCPSKLPIYPTSTPLHKHINDILYNN